MIGTRAHPPPRQERNLLAAYTGHEVDAALLFRFKALQVLGHFRETMWGVVAEASGTSALSDEEARGYADENYANFVKCRDEFEAASRAVALATSAAVHDAVTAVDLCAACIML